MLEEKLPFEQIVAVVEAQIETRRGSWHLTSVPWCDVKQMILTRACLKYHTFDPQRGQFSHWLSRLITRALLTILRDNYGTYARPCVQGCPFNTGGDGCSQTKSGHQCAECAIYRDWEKRKLAHHNVAQTLPLENHSQEVNSIQSDFMDIVGAKEVIDREMKKRLNKQGWRVYRMIYIQGKSEKDTAKVMGYKKQKGKMYPGYGSIRKHKKHFIELAKKIIDEQGLS